MGAERKVELTAEIVRAKSLLKRKVNTSDNGEGNGHSRIE
jgi:hypothetical protein